MKICWGFVVIGALAGCAATEETESQLSQAAGCQSWGCGTNSPTIGDGLLFDELDGAGTPNRGGIYLVGAALADGTPVEIGVDEDMLVAVPIGGGPHLRGTSLEGTIIHLRHDVKGDYELLVDRVYLQHLSFWAGDHEHVPAYGLKARRLGEALFKESACRNEALVTDPHWDGIEHAAIVFQGDRYDPKRKLVWETAATDTWFNVACAATTPAKLHLMRHTRAGSYDDASVITWDTSVSKRQAMLKMFAADFCGTGESFTEDNVELIYADSRGWYSDPRPAGGEEALWSSEGALCLDTPRLGRQKYEIEDICGRGIPSCAAFTPWQTWAPVRSALP